MRSEVGEITKLCAALKEAQAAVEAAEEELKRKLAHLRWIEEDALPNAMKELGYESMVLESGEEIRVFDDVSPRIPVAYREEAFEWLRAHNFGGLIKTEIKATFGMGDADEAKALNAELLERGINVGLNNTVHPQTLKAFVKESLREGRDIPLEIFGAKPVTKATVKPTKRKRK